MNKGINWIRLENEKGLEELKSLSRSKICMIFKYSRSCGSSAVTLDRLERSWNSEELDRVQPYFLDLITYRELSNQIEKVYGVRHESPQVILIENEEVIYDASHFWINYGQIRDFINGMVKSET